MPGTPVTAGLGTRDALLGQDSTLYTLEERRDVCLVSDLLAREARHSLLLLTEDLEPDIFSREAFLDSASELARRHPGSGFRILVRDGRRTVSRGHRLIELARKLSSHIEIRRPAVYHRDRQRTFLVADGKGYFDRPLANRYEGTANFNDPGAAEVLVREFEDVWEHATPERELARLYL